MTNGKIYYLLESGEVILYIPENLSEWATPTTREQDEVLYTPLQSYNPELVGLLELEEGQYASDFVSASGFRVNLDTMVLEFTFPSYHPPLTTKVNELSSQLANEITEKLDLQARLDATEMALMQMMLL